MVGETRNRTFLSSEYVISFIFKYITLYLSTVQNNAITINEPKFDVLASITYL